ncbi:tetratricopeptide repeat protein [uncultured Cohaesibacter sp.]|uniref:tetratricopeptide repeat protein n=1 Tax=uncultured Cohaesibacter sp. TaxID=1002546 RepID=UPI0029C98C33|nr:tetratricopeptide repeat protein [uncultured Cohaesibacter sp.]
MLAMEDRIAAAGEHLVANRIENAALIYESVLDINPRNAEALAGLADVYLRQGAFDKALRFASNAVSVNPSLPETSLVLAKAALASNKTGIAETALDSALELANPPAEAFALRADLLADAGQAVEAELLLNKALEVHGPVPQILTTLATLYLRDGLNAQALEVAQEALVLEPDNVAATGLVGAVLCSLKDYRNARPYIEKAHLLDPGNPLFLTYLAQVLIGEGEISDAIRTARRVTQINNVFLMGWGTYVRAMAFKGEVDHALSEFSALAKSHPNRIEALVSLAGAHKSVGQVSKALALLQPLLKNIKSLSSLEQRKVTAVLRDCCLSTCHWQQVRATFIGLDLRAMLGCETSDPTTLRDAFDQTTLLIDRQFNVLDIIPLLRFARPHDTTTENKGREVHGSGSLGEIVSLVDGLHFHANDIPRSDADDSLPQQINAFPLSAIMAIEENIPAPKDAFEPYIHAMPETLPIWEASLASLPRPFVGIVWDEHRPGLLLDDLAPMLDGFEGTIVSLVWDDARHQLKGHDAIIDAGVHFRSLADLTACLSMMDLVIGPDGLPMHVAGAMGREALLLCQPDKNWYWAGLEGTSAWYPSIDLLETAGFAHWSDANALFGDRIRARMNARIEALRDDVA